MISFGQKALQVRSLFRQTK